MYNQDNYFVADQVFVKYTTNQLGKEVIDDIVIIENKLSSTTPGLDYCAVRRRNILLPRAGRNKCMFEQNTD
jgi:hypothetical protein